MGGCGSYKVMEVSSREQPVQILLENPLWFDCPLLFPFLCSVVNWSMAIPTRCTPAVRLELDNEANHPNICKQRIPLKIIPFMENYGATGKGTYYLIP